MTATTDSPPKPAPTTAEKIARLPWSIGMTATNTAFVQFTFFGSVFVLFLDELGLSKGQIGFLLSLFPFFGLVALFIAPTVARFGYKRTFVTFYGLRKVVTAFLLLTPWVLAVYGTQTALVFVSGIVIAFALCRSVAETGRFPWVQEYVPNAVRGKYSATNNMFATVVGFVAVIIAGYVIGRSTGLNGFMLLIGVGVLFGFASVWAASHIPGGAPVADEGEKRATFWDMLDPTQDKNFVRYLLGAGFIILSISPLNSFVPLFMQEQVGLASGNVVYLQTGALLGGLVSTYLWGWAADRYGSKPVMLIGVLLSILLPIFWLIMPRHAPLSLSIALAIAFLKGIANMGWNIGAARLLFVNVVPPTQKTEYMALYYAWVGVVGGISQLLGGQILEWSQGIKGQLPGLILDPYTPLFLLGILFPIASLFILGQVRSDGRLSTGEFAGLFFRGNPFLAMGSLIGYHMARDEQAAVSATERLGRTRSRLTIDELLEALQDPRFNVRFEAIISIARTRPDERLTEAVIEILQGSELSLSVIAAWALGRIGDERALTALRQEATSDYRSIRAHCIRSLGTLDDAESIPWLLDAFIREEDKGLQMAYASTFGKFQHTDAIEPVLRVLDEMQNEGARMELALALARIVGQERAFIRLARQAQDDLGTPAAQILTGLKGKLSKSRPGDETLLDTLTRCADTLARNDLDTGAGLMAQLITDLTETLPDSPTRTILRACAVALPIHRAERPEYLILALHSLGSEIN